MISSDKAEKHEDNVRPQLNSQNSGKLADKSAKPNPSPALTAFRIYEGPAKFESSLPTQIRPENVGLADFFTAEAYPPSPRRRARVGQTNGKIYYYLLPAVCIGSRDPSGNSYSHIKPNNLGA